MILSRKVCLLTLVFAPLSLPLRAAETHSRRVEFTQEFRPSTGPMVEMWIPTPIENPGYQKLISRQISGNATAVRIGGETGNATPYIYAHWENTKVPELKIINVVEVFDREGATIGASDVGSFLGATPHVQTDGIVKETSEKIVLGLKDPDLKARAIYNWIVEKAARDPEVRGCGLGDVKSTLTTGNLRGKCADLNSLFVGLARAAGVPAREVFGQRVASSAFSPALGKFGDNSKAQHCRAEYYSTVKQKWIPVDPADVRKYILEEKLAPNDPRVMALRDKFFGYWEGTWIAFNHARDFVLDGYSTERLNYFMYPLLVNGATRPDGVDPQQAGYSFSTKLVQ